MKYLKWRVDVSKYMDWYEGHYGAIPFDKIDDEDETDEEREERQDAITSRLLDDLEELNNRDWEDDR